jgi:hypothetical protein
MEFAINAEQKIICHDCQKEIEIENGEIKNGVMLFYEIGGKKTRIFKCKECFEKSKSLKNYQICEVYSRVVGYYRPVQQWNLGKQEEFKERKEYKIKI